jgi:hypothetical protein
MSGSENE